MADKRYTGTGQVTTLLDDDVVSIQRQTPDGDHYIEILDFKTQLAPALSANTTVNFTSGMSAATIQGLIDAQPKNLNGFTLTFQFADGTYTLNDNLIWDSFYGGIFNVYGNAANNTKSTTKVVDLNFSATALKGIQFRNNDCVVNIRYLDVLSADSVQTISCVDSRIVKALYNYCHNAAGVGAWCVSVEGGLLYVEANIVGLCQKGIVSSINSKVTSRNNSDNGGGDQPANGLFATSGTIIKYDAIQPVGSTANEQTSDGGEIR